MNSEAGIQKSEERVLILNSDFWLPITDIFSYAAKEGAA
jgi:hypothetical protein